MAWYTYGCVSTVSCVVRLLFGLNRHQRKQTEIGFCRSTWTLNIFTENANKQKRCKGRQTDFFKMASVALYELETLGFCYTTDNCIIFFLYKFVLLVKNYIIDSAGNSLSFTKIEIFFSKLVHVQILIFKKFKCLERTLPFTRQTKSVSLGVLNRGTTIIVMRFPICIVDSFEC